MGVGTVFVSGKLLFRASRAADLTLSGVKGRVSTVRMLPGETWVDIESDWVEVVLEARIQ